MQSTTASLSALGGQRRPQAPRRPPVAPLRSATLGAIVVLALSGACAKAGGEVQGGGLTEAGAAATAQPKFDPSSAIPPAPCNGTGTHWTDLYNDIFGTKQPGSCNFEANCHGSADGEGAQTAGGIHCFDLKGCRQSLFDTNMVTPEDATAPEKSNLIGIVRHRAADGSLVGTMPQDPKDYIFSDTCLERIKTWIRDGAKDD